MNHHEIPEKQATTPSDGKSGYVKSASRALDILESLAATPDGLGFTDLVREQGIPKSSLHALLAVLTDRGYVELDADRRTYALGIRAWEIGQAWRSQRDLIRKALPAMERVVEAINETVQLAVLDGIENVYLAKVDCSHPVRLQSEVGKRLYAHATGLGKMLLASQTNDDLVIRYRDIPFPNVTTSPIHSLPGLLDEVSRIRERGFAVDDQEYTPGLRCVAVPIHDVDHRVIAALSASIPLMRARGEELQNALRTIASASIEISLALGATNPDQRLVDLTDWHGDVLALPAAHVDRR